MQMSFLQPLEKSGYQSDFIGRVPGVLVDTDRVATVARLQPFHQTKVEQLGFQWQSCWRAEQVHGGAVAVADSLEGRVVDGVDGLVTNVPGVMLAIYVADCGAVYLLDEKNQAIGLVHSGKKGTEAEITKAAIEKMGALYGTLAEDVVVVLAPCIRPPAYDVDFAADIRKTVEKLGVKQYVDCCICTSSDLDLYYSYRVEKGSTGRMLALFGIEG